MFGLQHHHARPSAPASSVSVEMSVLGPFILPSSTVLQLSSQVKADLCGPNSGWMFEIG